MINRLIILFILCLTHFQAFSFGDSKAVQTTHIITTLLSLTTTSSDSTLYLENYQSTLSYLKKKQGDFNNDRKMLKHLFYKIHKIYLKKYEPSQPFSTTLQDGRYGCLTGTIVYALFLEDLGFDYKILLSNYHILITVNINDTTYLLESTDPVDGFVSNSKEVKQRLESMRLNNRKEVREEEKHSFKTQIMTEVSLSNLIGVQLYNLSIVAYNQGKTAIAARLLSESKKYYTSELIKEYASLLISQLSNQLSYQENY